MFDKQSCRDIRLALEQALANVATDLGVKITVGNASYSSSHIVFKLEVAEITKDGVAMTKEATTFTQLASLYGLKPTDLNRTFTWGGKQFTLVGLAPRRSKYPFIGMRGDGKRFKFGQEIVKLLD